MYTLTENYQYRLLKRVLDVLVSLVVLILIFPLLIVIACVIRYITTGPTIQSQQRVGLHGRLFHCYQFYVGNVSTVYRQLLQRSSLQHLPVLWNVLKGDLSLIGTEPRMYDDELPEYFGADRLKRLSVRPGLIGTWRISRNNRFGHSPLLNQYLDEQYVENLSFLTDLKIFMQAFFSLIKWTRCDEPDSTAKYASYRTPSLPLRRIEPMVQNLAVFLPTDPFYAETLLSIENMISSKQIKTVIMIGSWLGSIVQAVASKLSDDGIVYDINMWIGSLPEKLNQQDPNISCLQQMFLVNMQQINDAHLTHKIVSLTMNVMEAASALSIRADLIFFDNRRHAANLIANDSFLESTKGIVCGNCWFNKEQQRFVIDYAAQRQKTIHTENDFWWIE
ncbi:MAG: sugar transferase [Parachlamydiaceae bacterium]